MQIQLFETTNQIHVFHDKFGIPIAVFCCPYCPGFNIQPRVNMFPSPRKHNSSKFDDNPQVTAIIMFINLPSGC